MSTSRIEKTKRKESIAAANDRDAFERTSFGRQRTRTKVGVIGVVLLALATPLIYIYDRIRNRPA